MWNGRENRWTKGGLPPLWNRSPIGETFDLKMLMGRWWTEGNELSVVLNESAVRAMGLQDPVGSIIRMPGGQISA